MSDLLLSIYIPTYNRSYYLKKCLSAFFSQLNEENLKLVEVCVSDNDSPDNTSEVVADFIREGNKINYFKQPTNIGADRNVASCFAKAKGKYVWIFGDDDFVMPHTLEKIIKILKSNDLGVLYLNNIWYNHQEDIIAQNFNELNYITYNDSLKFFDKINYWTTFASSNIVNKKVLDIEDWLDKFDGTNFQHLSWTISAIFKSKQNIYIEDNVIACKASNSGGYSLFRAFGNDINVIMNYYVEHGYDKKIKPIMNNNLLSKFFPYYIQNPSNKFLQERYIQVLFPVFWHYKAFWKHIVPLWLLPYKRRFWFLNPITLLKRSSTYFYSKVINQNKISHRS